MAITINQNSMATNTSRNLSKTYDKLGTSIQRMSTGLRVNTAADDAAGLAIREMMRADITATQQGIRNAADAISLIQTADGALGVVDEKLTRMKELAEQAATGTYTTVQRDIINSEYQAMAAEIDRIASATNFNGIKLLDGSVSNQHGGQGIKVHFGTGNEDSEDYYFLKIGDARATSSTGLQVGGDAKNDIWGQGGAAGSATAAGCCANGFDSLAGQAGFVSGQSFSYGYNWDWQQDDDAKLESGKYIAGRYQVGASDSLQDLVDKVNAGTQSRVAIEVDGSALNAAVGQGSGTAAVCIGNESYYWGDTEEVEGNEVNKVKSTYQAKADYAQNANGKLATTDAAAAKAFAMASASAQVTIDGDYNAALGAEALNAAMDKRFTHTIIDAADPDKTMAGHDPAYNPDDNAIQASKNHDIAVREKIDAASAAAASAQADFNAAKATATSGLTDAQNGAVEAFLAAKSDLNTLGKLGGEQDPAAAGVGKGIDTTTYEKAVDDAKKAAIDAGVKSGDLTALAAAQDALNEANLALDKAKIDQDPAAVAQGRFDDASAVATEKKDALAGLAGDVTAQRKAASTAAHSADRAVPARDDIRETDPVDPNDAIKIADDDYANYTVEEKQQKVADYLNAVAQKALGNIATLPTANEKGEDANIAWGAVTSGDNNATQQGASASTISTAFAKEAAEATGAKARKLANGLAEAVKALDGTKVAAAATGATAATAVGTTGTLDTAFAGLLAEVDNVYGTTKGADVKAYLKAVALGEAGGTAPTATEKQKFEDATFVKPGTTTDGTATNKDSDLSKALTEAATAYGKAISSKISTATDGTEKLSYKSVGDATEYTAPAAASITKTSDGSNTAIQADATPVKTVEDKQRAVSAYLEAVKQDAKNDTDTATNAGSAKFFWDGVTSDNTGAAANPSDIASNFKNQAADAKKAGFSERAVGVASDVEKALAQDGGATAADVRAAQKALDDTVAAATGTKGVITAAGKEAITKYLNAVTADAKDGTDTAKDLKSGFDNATYTADGGAGNLGGTDLANSMVAAAKAIGLADKAITAQAELTEANDAKAQAGDNLKLAKNPPADAAQNLADAQSALTAATIAQASAQAKYDELEPKVATYTNAISAAAASADTLVGAATSATATPPVTTATGLHKVFEDSLAAAQAAAKTDKDVNGTTITDDTENRFIPSGDNNLGRWLDESKKKKLAAYADETYKNANGTNKTAVTDAGSRLMNLGETPGNGTLTQSLAAKYLAGSAEVVAMVDAAKQLGYGERAQGVADDIKESFDNGDLADKTAATGDITKAYNEAIAAYTGDQATATAGGLFKANTGADTTAAGAKATKIQTYLDAVRSDAKNGKTGDDATADLDAIKDLTYGDSATDTAKIVDSDSFKVMVAAAKAYGTAQKAAADPVVPAFGEAKAELADATKAVAEATEQLDAAQRVVDIVGDQSYNAEIGKQVGEYRKSIHKEDATDIAAELSSATAAAIKAWDDDNALGDAKTIKQTKEDYVNAQVRDIVDKYTTLETGVYVDNQKNATSDTELYDQAKKAGWHEATVNIGADLSAFVQNQINPGGQPMNADTLANDINKTVTRSIKNQTDGGDLYLTKAFEATDIQPDNVIRAEDIKAEDVDTRSYMERTGGLVDDGNQKIQVAGNAEGSNKYTAEALAQAINENKDSSYWAMTQTVPNAKGDPQQMVYVFNKEGGDNNSTLACEQAGKLSSASNAAAAAIDFQNMETDEWAESGTKMSLGGEHWATMTPQQTKSNKGHEVWNVTLNGRDVGKERDLWISDKGEISMPGLDDSNINGMARDGFHEIQNASNAEWAGADVRTQSAAQEALAALDNAIVNKDKIRADLGALQNRLENTMTNLEIQSENLQASESRISDVDTAKEMTEFTKNNVLTQAGVSMLSQANSLSQLALSLMR